jgi:hypothetical protein
MVYGFDFWNPLKPKALPPNGGSESFDRPSATPTAIFGVGGAGGVGSEEANRNRH